MAHGLRCVHCGWQEASHVAGDGDPEYLMLQHGYTYTMLDCPGFDLSAQDQQVARELEARENEETEWAGQVYAHRAQAAPIIWYALSRDMALYAVLADWMRNSDMRCTNKH